MTTPELNLRLHLERLVLCLSEAVNLAQHTAPGGAHNGWAAAVNDAIAALETGQPELENTFTPVATWPPTPWTPGPWQRNRYDPKWLESAHGRALACLTCQSPPDSEADANGRLIEHAPDLAQAARGLLERLDILTTWEYARGGERVERERLRAVLADIFLEATPC